jgi:hypothetical protein
MGFDWDDTNGESNERSHLAEDVAGAIADDAGVNEALREYLRRRARPQAVPPNNVLQRSRGEDAHGERPS